VSTPLIGSTVAAVGAFFLGEDRADCLLDFAQEMFLPCLLSCCRSNSSNSSGGISNWTFVFLSSVDAAQCRENGKAWATVK